VLLLKKLLTTPFLHSFSFSGKTLQTEVRELRGLTQQTKRVLTACLTHPARGNPSHQGSSYTGMPTGTQPPGGRRKIVWEADTARKIFKTPPGLQMPKFHSNQTPFGSTSPASRCNSLFIIIALLSFWECQACNEVRAPLFLMLCKCRRELPRSSGQ